MLWNYMPIECFPLTFDLNGFKSRINKIESQLRTTALPILEIKRCVHYKKKEQFGSNEGSVRRHWRPCFTAVDNANSTGGLKGHSVPPKILYQDTGNEPFLIQGFYFGWKTIY